MAARPFLGTCSVCAPAPTLVDYESCCICHDEGPLLVEVRDPDRDSGRLLVPSCAEHLREAFEYLLTIEAPRRGWRYGVTKAP
jgi:hypothetical protein